MGEIAEIVLKILHEGIINIASARGFQDNKLNHICLYKKMMNTTIQIQMYISSQQEVVEKTNSNDTNLIDEWRNFKNISPEKIVGLALPYDFIQGYLNEEALDEEEKNDKQKLRMCLQVIEKTASDCKMFIANSNNINFTDILDSELSKSNIKTK